MYDVIISTKDQYHVAMAEDLDHIRLVDGVVIVNTPKDNVFMVPLHLVEFVETKHVEEVATDE